MKSFRKTSFFVALVACVAFTGCAVTVPQGVVGRIKHRGGWDEKVLPQGRHQCFGFDQMYFAESTQETFAETLQILVGGKVNLTIKINTRAALASDGERTKEVFVNVPTTNLEMYSYPTVTRKSLYETYIKMLVQSIPRDYIGEMTDIQSVVDNRQEISAEVKKQILEASKATPMDVFDIRIVNYDWPDRITDAQERLAEIELSEKEEAAKVRANLKKAQGELEVEEANKLLEMKRAEAIAESIDIIRDKLQNAPEYLQWHTVRAMSEAAKGPNNAFIMFPYNMPGMESNMMGMMDTALLDQVLKADSDDAPVAEVSESEFSSTATELPLKK